MIKKNEDDFEDDDDDADDDNSFSGSYQVSGWAVNGRELAGTATNDHPFYIVITLVVMMMMMTVWKFPKRKKKKSNLFGPRGGRGVWCLIRVYFLLAPLLFIRFM